MANAVLSKISYGKLVSDIRKLIEQGKVYVEQAVSQQLINTYWQIGKRISDEGLSSNAGYNVAILKDVAEELQMDYSTLTRCVSFFQSYRIAPGGNSLTWSHYKKLITLDDKRERKWYEQLAIRKNLNRLQLAKAIKDDVYNEINQVELQKIRAKSLKRPTEPTYLYKAEVKRVIDGDTMILNIDLGFQVWKEQRIRLAGIDAPPMNKAGGQEAYQYLRDKLAKVSFVMVKTNKIDIYGRYVGHIFYSPQKLSKNEIFLKGNYLNQELIQKGLAKAL